MSTIYHSLIGGKWVAGADEFEVVDPGMGKPFARCSSVGHDEAMRAIDNADRAFRDWERLPAMRRADYLLAVCANMRNRRDEIATELTRENGKPFFESQIEVDVAIDHFRWFAEEGRRAYGRIVPNQVAGKRHWVLKRPFGVVAAIAPWNFPLALSARKVAPALAAGCTVILRPARQTPISCVMMAECIVDAGIPSGVFQLLLGSAGPISDAFMRHPACQKVSLTGSTPVGKKLIAASAESITKLALELGGQAPVVVFADCDLDAAIDGAVKGKIRNVGQSCVAANRFYVERSIYSAFVEGFAARLASLQVDYGLNPGSQVGALESEKGLNHAMAQIEDAKQRGATVVTGGQRVNVGGDYADGVYLAPTVLADVPHEALCMREETFAPVAPVHPFDSEHEAIAKANDTQFGLAAYAYTSNLNRAIRISEQLEAGSIGINDPVPSTSNCPFGGFKQSGSGRELGIEGLDEFLEPVHVSIGGLEW